MQDSVAEQCVECEGLPSLFRSKLACGIGETIVDLDELWLSHVFLKCKMDSRFRGNDGVGVCLTDLPFVILANAGIL